MKSYGLSLDIFGGQLEIASSRYDVATSNMVVVMVKAEKCQNFWLVGDVLRNEEPAKSQRAVSENATITTIENILTTRELNFTAVFSSQTASNSIYDDTNSISGDSNVSSKSINEMKNANGAIDNVRESLKDAQFSSTNALLELD